jgi:hypothetical protein
VTQVNVAFRGGSKNMRESLYSEAVSDAQEERQAAVREITH